MEMEAVVRVAVRVIFTLFLLLVHPSSCCCRPSSITVVPYRLGNFSYKQPETPPSKFLDRRVIYPLSRLWNNHARFIRICVFLYNTRFAATSILEDSWEAVRNPDRISKDIWLTEERKVVLRRTRQAETLRKLVGAGYTPRLVWLFGLMLRGIIQCTALPQIFDPPIGFGAGAVAAARFAHREWIPCIMLGYYGSTFYWKRIFGVAGMPNEGKFDGVPIKVRRVRI